MATNKEEKKTVFTVKDYLATEHGAVHDVLPENKPKPKKKKVEPAPKSPGDK